MINYMKEKNTFRFWALLLIGLAALAGLGLLMSYLSQGPADPVPVAASTATSLPEESADPTEEPESTQELATASTSPLPTPAPESTVATVNGHPIQYSTWKEAVLLDQVLSGLAGSPAPAPDATLERLVNEELVLAAFPSHAPSEDQVEQQIVALEQSWQVSDAAVVTALENVGLARGALQRTIGRLLSVQNGLATLTGPGRDTATWLEEQRTTADLVINVDKEMEESTLALAAAPQPQSPLATPTLDPSSRALVATPISAPGPGTGSLSSAPIVPKVAPDFTLRRVNSSESFTLSQQLAQGPVVLVFFQKCG